jgi:hypothetical protein
VRKHLKVKELNGVKELRDDAEVECLRGVARTFVLSASKHAECYHTGDDNRRVIQGTVELRCCMVILGAGVG